MAATATIESSFRALPEPMQQAATLAFQAAERGSLAIGATVACEGDVIATGRNRLHEEDSGEDHIAGTSLAHAELNALAKLQYHAHESDVLELDTTLQPCLQCLGAIHLAPIARVFVLAPDPLWTGLATIRDATPFIAARWRRVDSPRASTPPASPATRSRYEPRPSGPNSVRAFAPLMSWLPAIASTRSKRRLRSLRRRRRRLRRRPDNSTRCARRSSTDPARPAAP